MRYAGSDSWLIRISEWEQQLEWALWMRAAERIPVPAGDEVPGPLEIEPLPEPTSASGGEAMAVGWLYWWRAALGLYLSCEKQARDWARRTGPVDEGWFDPPDFGALDPHPELQRAVVARWPEMAEWQGVRKRAGTVDLQQVRSRGPGWNRTGDIVRDVEAEIGHKAAPFRLNLVFLPVADDEIRGVGDRTFLVPERLRDTPAYQVWLHRLVRALA